MYSAPTKTRLSLVVLGCVMFAGTLHGDTLSVCMALDQAKELDGRVITVRGFLWGSIRHGLALYDSSPPNNAPCPRWPTHFFTAPDAIELGEAAAWTEGADEFRSLVQEMGHRYSQNEFAPIEVEVSGRLERKFALLIFRMLNGTYVGNGFGQGGGLAAILKIRSIRKVKAQTAHESPLGRPDDTIVQSPAKEVAQSAN